MIYVKQANGSHTYLNPNLIPAVDVYYDTNSMPTIHIAVGTDNLYYHEFKKIPEGIFSLIKKFIPLGTPGRNILDANFIFKHINVILDDDQGCHIIKTSRTIQDVVKFIHECYPPFGVSSESDRSYLTIKYQTYDGKIYKTAPYSIERAHILARRFQDDMA